MPKLQEDEWDKILNNVSVISFMQGLSIGGKYIIDIQLLQIQNRRSCKY